MVDSPFLVFHCTLLAEAYLHMLPPQGHSTVGVAKCCGGFVAIWLRAREEFADNHFQLLFIYIDKIMHIQTTYTKFWESHSAI